LKACLGRKHDLNYFSPAGATAFLPYRFGKRTMTIAIPDFTGTELKLVSASLFERYGKLVPFQLADSELQLDPASEELTLCPTIYWAERGAQFVVCKAAPDMTSTTVSATVS
jgi:hypothetical protein